MTVLTWLARYPEFAVSYAQARDVGWDVFAEKIVERATDVPPELAQSRKLEVDTGKWLLSKLAARRYGDRIDVKQELTGPGGGPIQVDVMIAHILSPENIAKLTEAEIEIWQQALATVPRLLAPPGSGAKVIEGKAVELAPSTPADSE
jgi:hypothetical protein